MPKRTSTMKLSERLEKLIAALQREEQSIKAMLSMPTTGERAKVRFKAQARVLHDFVEILMEAAQEKEENLQRCIISAQAVIDEDRVQSADAIAHMREELWTTDEETPEEDKADKDYPQLWIPTAEHAILQRLQKQIQSMLKAHEQRRQ